MRETQIERERKKVRKERQKEVPNPTAVFNFESENVEIKHFDTFWN